MDEQLGKKLQLLRVKILEAFRGSHCAEINRIIASDDGWEIDMESYFKSKTWEELLTYEWLEDGIDISDPARFMSGYGFGYFLPAFMIISIDVLVKKIELHYQWDSSEGILRRLQKRTDGQYWETLFKEFIGTLNDLQKSLVARFLYLVRLHELSLEKTESGVKTEIQLALESYWFKFLSSEELLKITEPARNPVEGDSSEDKLISYTALYDLFRSESLEDQLAGLHKLTGQKFVQDPAVGKLLEDVFHDVREDHLFLNWETASNVHVKLRIAELLTMSLPAESEYYEAYIIDATSDSSSTVRSEAMVVLARIGDLSVLYNCLDAVVEKIPDKEYGVNEQAMLEFLSLMSRLLDETTQACSGVFEKLMNSKSANPVVRKLIHNELMKSGYFKTEFQLQNHTE